MPKAAKKTTTRSKRPDPLGQVDTNTSKKSKAGAKGSKTDSAASKKASSATSSSSKTSNDQAKPTPRTYDSYILHCAIAETYDPMISRVLSVPSACTFSRLHEILQAAFDWGNCHAHSFQIQESLPATSQQLMPKALLNIEPEGNVEMMREFAESVSEDEITVGQIFGPESKYHGSAVQYEYDHGDSWEHQITCLGQAHSGLRQALGGIEQDFFCITGEGHPCAEDCGGPPGWDSLKELFTKKGKKDPEGLRDWYKETCLNGNRKGLDPYKWDILDVNDALQPFKV
ncbi:MAG: hypothetical protein Q9227_004588 [Pyrenula ochraceoflavens]